MREVERLLGGDDGVALRRSEHLGAVLSEAKQSVTQLMMDDVLPSGAVVAAVHPASFVARQGVDLFSENIRIAVASAQRAAGR